jgi:hypothetical protein
MDNIKTFDSIDYPSSKGEDSYTLDKINPFSHN